MSLSHNNERRRSGQFIDYIDCLPNFGTYAPTQHPNTLSRLFSYSTKESASLIELDGYHGKISYLFVTHT